MTPKKAFLICAAAGLVAILLPSGISNNFGSTVVKRDPVGTRIYKESWPLPGPRLEYYLADDGLELSVYDDDVYVGVNLPTHEIILLRKGQHLICLAGDCRAILDRNPKLEIAAETIRTEVRLRLKVDNILAKQKSSKKFI